MTAAGEALRGFYLENARAGLVLEASSLTLHPTAEAPPGSVVVHGGPKPGYRPLDGGGLRVTRGLFWSLLDPAEAGRWASSAEEVGDPEEALKAEGRRLLVRLE